MKNASQPLLAACQIGELTLKNRVVLAPTTRDQNTPAGPAPTPALADYYAQRASAGLLLTEPIWVSPQAIGVPAAPSLHTPAQVAAWQAVTAAVHAQGGVLFAQLGHAGAASYPELLAGALPVGPSAINPQMRVLTPHGVQDTLPPRALTLAEIKQFAAGRFVSLTDWPKIFYSASVCWNNPTATAQRTRQFV